MEATLTQPRPATLHWPAVIANLLPIWLLSLAVSIEGFPRPPIPGWLGISAFYVVFPVSLWLLWKRWIRIELLVYSLLPLALLGAFDEITTTYKTPFIFSCALLLSLGAVAYQSRLPAWLRGLCLVAGALLTVAAASHATLGFWQMAEALGYHECFPDYSGCIPLTGDETPWWQLFFSF